MSLRHLIKTSPLVGPIAKGVHDFFARRVFPGSADYWERRYRSGRDSGTGSRGRLARFKADTLNAFVAANDVTSVVELGCGDGYQLSLAHYPRYVGVDVSSTVLERCRAQFGADQTKSFVHLDQFDQRGFDLAMSLDVIFHLVEDRVFESHLERLFDSSSRFVAIYSSNEDGIVSDAHVRHRCFTDWIAQQRREWEMIEKITNPFPYDPLVDETSPADFYFFRRAGSSAGAVVSRRRDGA